jgi:intein/homing endonuclease
MNNKKRYTEEEIDFIKKNYPLYGPKYCGKILNKSEGALYAQANRMKLKKIGVNKHPSMQKINPEQFWNINKTEVAYILGYLWADGSIIYRKNKTCNYYGIRLEINSEDANDIEQYMNSLGSWAKVVRKRNENWKETTTFSTNSRDIYEFLRENDYLTKSLSEPTKILARLPDKLKPYFWRGFFDGDGSLGFAPDKNKHWKSLQFSSSYEYKWLEIINLFSELKIESFNLSKYIHPKTEHKASKITVSSKDGISKMIKYLNKSVIGLSRKTNKMKEFYIRFGEN